MMFVYVVKATACITRGMEDFMRPEFNNIGIDYDKLMERFMKNESLVIRFLKKFMEDQTFAHLQSSYKACDGQDYEALINDVHALKGLSANLSMLRLYDLTNEWLHDLRNENYGTSEILYQQCLQEYTKIIQGLKEIFGV